MFVKLFSYEIFITKVKGFTISNVLCLDRDKTEYGIDTYIHILGVYIIVSRNIKA